MEIASIVASIVSVVLGLLAIALAVYFYTQTTSVEKNVQLALTAIQTQTNTLQALNHKTMDRLTRFATTPRDDTSAQTVEMLVSTIREIPNIVLSFHPPSDTTGETALRRELVDAYILLWHYVGLVNIWTAGYLPTAENFIETDEFHRRVKQLVDNSANDFEYLGKLVSRVDAGQIQSSRYFHLYEDALISQSPVVGDTAERWARLARG